MNREDATMGEIIYYGAGKNFRDFDREIFSDEKSKQIFDYRIKYYQTGDMEYILEMVVKEYRDFIRRLDELKERIYARLNSFEGSYVIYGAGANGRLTLEYLKENGLGDRFIGYCVSDTADCEQFCGGGELVKTISEIESEKIW